MTEQKKHQSARSDGPRILLEHRRSAAAEGRRGLAGVALVGGGMTAFGVAMFRGDPGDDPGFALVWFGVTASRPPPSSGP